MHKFSKGRTRGPPISMYNFPDNIFSLCLPKNEIPIFFFSPSLFFSILVFPRSRQSLSYVALSHWMTTVVQRILNINYSFLFTVTWNYPDRSVNKRGISTMQVKLRITKPTKYPIPFFFCVDNPIASLKFLSAQGLNC